MSEITRHDINKDILEDLLKVIDIYKNVNKDNLEELNKMLSDMFDNLGKGFLHEESIYRVKKDDK